MKNRINKLRNIVETTDTRSGVFFDLIIQFLIVVSIVVFSMETLPNLNKDTVQTLFYIEFVLIIIFCAEYTIRFLIAEKKLSFVLSFWGLVDLLAILPFFLLSFDMVLIRTLRLLRLLRILKLGRYSQSVNRMVNALKIAKEDLIIALLASIIMLIVAGFGIYQFENAAQPDKFSSVFESLWWALATLTTVGYGDVYPITAGGRVFTGIILFIGLGIVAIPAGIISSSMTEARKKDMQ